MKYVVKYYIGSTHHMISRMRNNDSALSMSTMFGAEYLGNR